ncbi:unnamed protein product [Peniophora sp. CBMAI 1063]|nr:unnamed protein product [Peniophora sp. CBMAI 1063]
MSSMEPDELSFKMQTSDLDALIQADHMSEAALSAVDSPERWKEAVALLRTSKTRLEDISRVFSHREAHLVAKLNERANRTLPIFRLDYDVLHLIFTLVAAVDRQSKRSERGKWLQLGHVCKHWWAVLHDMASLWAHDVFAVFNGRRGFKDVFTLARDSPLDLVPPARINRFASTIPSVFRPTRLLEHFLPLLGRARLFDSMIDYLDDWVSMSKVLSSSPLPHLEELVLQWQSHLRAPISEIRVQLGDHPKLRFLKTYGYIARPHPGNSLTSLDMSLLVHRATGMPSQAELSDLLLSMGKLKHLKLGYWCPTFRYDPACLIKFPELQTLVITDESSVESSVNLLRCLRLPAVVQCFIDVTAMGNHVDEQYIADSATVQSMFDCLGTSLAGSPAISHRSHLYVHHSETQTLQSLAKLSIRWSAVYVPKNNVWRWPFEKPVPELCLSIMTARTDAADIPGIVSRHVKSAGAIHDLAFIDWQEMLTYQVQESTYSYLRTALAPFKHAQSLQVCDAQVGSMTLRSALHALVQSEAEQSSEPLLDSIRRVRLSATKDWNSLHKLLSFNRVGDRPRQGRLLAEFIRKRAARGKPIEALELRLTNAHKSQYTEDGHRAMEGESLLARHKEAILHFAKEVGARAEFVRVEVEDTGEVDIDYPIWKTHQYIDVLLTYDITSA